MPLTRVQFRKPWKNYNSGETAGFSKDLAEFLQQKGFVRITGMCGPVATTAVTDNAGSSAPAGRGRGRGGRKSVVEETTVEADEPVEGDEE